MENYHVSGLGLNLWLKMNGWNDDDFEAVEMIT
jgi:hypothetical protein